MARSIRERSTLYHRYFNELVAAIPAPKSIVFVRYRPTHVAHYSLVRNVADIASARAWVVYDRGSDNERLLRLAPDRVPYLFDETELSITPLDHTDIVATPLEP